MKILKFYSKTCQPCKTYSPLVEDICKLKAIELINIDVEDDPILASEVGVRSVPMLAAYTGEGANPKVLIGSKSRSELLNWLESLAA